MQSLENHIWRSRLAISTCISPIFVYGSDCWAISKTDARKIDALDQWCLHMYQFVRNDDVRRLTKQPKLTAIIQLRHIFKARTVKFGMRVQTWDFLPPTKFYKNRLRGYTPLGKFIYTKNYRFWGP